MAKVGARHRGVQKRGAPCMEGYKAFLRRVLNRSDEMFERMQESLVEGAVQSGAQSWLSRAHAQNDEIGLALGVRKEAWEEGRRAGHHPCHSGGCLNGKTQFCHPYPQSPQPSPSPRQHWTGHFQALHASLFLCPRLNGVISKFPSAPDIL